MCPAAVRIGDPIDCGDKMGEGSGDVFVNNIPFSRRSVDKTTGHPKCYPPTTISSASPNVFINDGNGGDKAVRVGDPIVPHAKSPCKKHGGKVSAGSPDVFVNDDLSLTNLSFHLSGRVGGLFSKADVGYELDEFQSSTSFPSCR